jgi:transposase
LVSLERDGPLGAERQSQVFGDWNSVFRRFNPWSDKGVWWQVFEAPSDDPDFEGLIVDSTIRRNWSLAKP